MRFAGAMFLLAGVSGAQETPGRLGLTCLELKDVDLGAGLAVVLQTPSGKTYLYDTGVGYARDGGWVGDYNAGRDTIAPFLRERRIERIDGIFMSHAHSDHYGGLLWLAENMPVGTLYDSGYEYRGAGDPGTSAGELKRYADLRETFRARGAYVKAVAGDRLKIDERLDVEVVGPPKDYFGIVSPEKRPKHDGPSHYLVNANSLMLRITFGEHVFLFPGDIQDVDQREQLMKAVAPEKLRCHVLIAPGHGLHCIPEFAEAARPEVTICSIHARYANHVRALATRVFGAVGSKVYLTAHHGSVTVESDGRTSSVRTEREPAGSK